MRLPISPEEVSNIIELPAPRERRGRAGASPRRSAKTRAKNEQRQARAQRPPQTKGTLSRKSRQAAARLGTKAKKG